MTSSSDRPAKDQAAARRARYFFYVLGIIFSMLAIVLDLAPAFAEVVSDRAVKACALIAIMLLVIGRFSSDRWVRRCEGLLRLWH